MDLPENEYLAYCIVSYLVSQGYVYDYNSDFWGAVEWLDMCSGLETVQISPSKYDEGLLYCGNAWDYSVSKSKLSSTLSTELIHFLFSWGALESLVKAFVPNKKQQNINTLCSYLKTQHLEKLLPAGYLSEYEHMVELLQQIPSYEEILIKLKLETHIKYSFGNYVDMSGVGAYVVSKIRNNFVHGQLRFPEPEEYSGEESFNVELIHTATRITLMTMLMLLISDIKDNDFILEDAPDDGIEYSALMYLRNLCSFQPEQSDVISGQIQLTEFFDTP